MGLQNFLTNLSGSLKIFLLWGQLWKWKAEWASTETAKVLIFKGWRTHNCVLDCPTTQTKSKIILASSTLVSWKLVRMLTTSLHYKLFINLRLTNVIFVENSIESLLNFYRNYIYLHCSDSTSVDHNSKIVEMKYEIETKIIHVFKRGHGFFYNRESRISCKSIFNLQPRK
jgi:hypothetical protein